MKVNAMRRVLTMTAFAATLAVLCTAAVGQTGASASDKDSHVTHHPAGGKSADSGFSEAEVRKVNKDAGKITLKHGPIPNLDMGPMSMVFRAKDPAMLDAVKAGDKVRFKADKIQGSYTIIEIQLVK
jgi:Cu(I)/Ag(I) efflux system periplasmic protein CusF